MYGVIALTKVKERQIEEFEKVAGVLAKSVAANEPDNKAFDVFKVRNAPGQYKIFEVYNSKDAFKAHVGTEHFKTAMPEMEATFAESMEGELLEGL
jgi:(4S)-4-hydroxy-5-phosphonooxypentane-2,3-dione isomerase